jgi:hypothetical protein
MMFHGWYKILDEIYIIIHIILHVGRPIFLFYGTLKIEKESIFSMPLNNGIF